MFILKKTFRFEAAHQLVHHDGKCAKMHGHSWVVVVEVKGDTLHKDGPKENMLLDFSDLKAIVQPAIDILDHNDPLNEVLGVDMPTSEYLAMWLYNFIKPQLPSLYAVTIHETCTSECRYQPE